MATPKEIMLAGHVNNFAIELSAAVDTLIELVKFTDMLYKTGYVQRTDTAVAEIQAVAANVATELANIPAIQTSEITDDVLALNPETAHLSKAEFEAVLDAALKVYIVWQLTEGTLRRGISGA